MLLNALAGSASISRLWWLISHSAADPLAEKGLPLHGDGDVHVCTGNLMRPPCLALRSVSTLSGDQWSCKVENYAESGGWAGQLFIRMRHDVCNVGNVPDDAGCLLAVSGPVAAALCELAPRSVCLLIARWVAEGGWSDTWCGAAGRGRALPWSTRGTLRRIPGLPPTIFPGRRCCWVLLGVVLGLAGPGSGRTCEGASTLSGDPWKRESIH